jgi:hypothetical protein
MSRAAYVEAGPSLKHTLDELKAFDSKIFASSAVQGMLEAEGVRCQKLNNRLAVIRLREFGFKEIHLFGGDMSNAEGEGVRVAFDDGVYWTTPEQAQHAQEIVSACMDLTAKGVRIVPHGDGMCQAMIRATMRVVQERPLTAVYDMQVSPPTYEVFSFLAEAEKYRSQNGFACIDVVFAPGPIHGFRDDGLPPSPEERAAMLHRICVGGTRLLTTVRNVHVMKQRAHLTGDFFPPDWTNDRPRFHYGPRFQKNGHPCLEATPSAREAIRRRFGGPYTTITLREAEYWPARNSNRAAWYALARELQWMGMPAVIVPDTYGAGLQGHQNLPQASWDVDLRLALYEGAALNLGVVNGPMVLCMFAAKRPPYIIFQKPDETSPGTQESFMMAQGFKPGDAYTPNGWALWEDDTPENVLRAAKNWFEMKKEVSMA